MDSVPPFDVSPKRSGGRTVQGNEPFLAELGMSYSQKALKDVYVVALETDGFAYAQSGNGQKTQERGVGPGP